MPGRKKKFWVMFNFSHAFSLYPKRCCCSFNLKIKKIVLFSPPLSFFYIHTYWNTHAGRGRATSSLWRKRWVSEVGWLVVVVLVEITKAISGRRRKRRRRRNGGNGRITKEALDSLFFPLSLFLPVATRSKQAFGVVVLDANTYAILSKSFI